MVEISDSRAEEPAEDALQNETPASLELTSEKQLAASAAGEAPVVIEQGEPTGAILAFPPASEMREDKSVLSGQEVLPEREASNLGSSAVENSKEVARPTTMIAEDNEDGAQEKGLEKPAEEKRTVKPSAEKSPQTEISGSGGGEKPPDERPTPSGEDEEPPKSSAIEEILKNAEKRPDIAAAIRGESENTAEIEEAPATEKEPEEPTDSTEVRYKEGEGPHPYTDVFLQDAADEITGDTHPVVRGEVVDSRVEVPESATEPAIEASEASLVSAAVEEEVFMIGSLGSRRESYEVRVDRVFDTLMATGVEFDPLLYSPLWYAVVELYDEIDDFGSMPTFARLSEILQDSLIRGTGQGADNDVVMAYDFQNVKEALHRLDYYPRGVLSTVVKDYAVTGAFYKTAEGEFIAQGGAIFMPPPPNIIATALRNQVLPGAYIDFPEGYDESTLAGTITAYNLSGDHAVLMSDQSVKTLAKLGKELWELNNRGDLSPALDGLQKQSVAHFLKTIGPIE